MWLPRGSLCIALHPSANSRAEAYESCAPGSRPECGRVLGTIKTQGGGGFWRLTARAYRSRPTARDLRTRDGQRRLLGT